MASTEKHHQLPSQVPGQGCQATNFVEANSTDSLIHYMMFVKKCSNSRASIHLYKVNDGFSQTLDLLVQVCQFIVKLESAYNQIVMLI